MASAAGLTGHAGGAGVEWAPSLVTDAARGTARCDGLGASVVGTRFAHGAFDVVGRAFVGAAGLHTAEADELLGSPVKGGRRSLSRWIACRERVGNTTLGPSWVASVSMS